MSGRYNRGGSGYRGRGSGSYNGYYRGGRGGSGGYYHPYDNGYGYDRRPQYSGGRQYNNSSVPPSTGNVSGEYDYYAAEEQHGAVLLPSSTSTSEPSAESSSNNTSRDIPLDSSPANSRSYYQQQEYYSPRGSSRGGYRGRGRGGYRGGYYQNRDANYGYYYNEQQDYDQYNESYNYDYYGKGYEENTSEISRPEDLTSDPNSPRQLQPQQPRQPLLPPTHSFQRKSYYENHSYHDSRIPTSGRHSNSPYVETSVLEEERKQRELKEKKEREEKDGLNHWVLRLGLEGDVKESLSNSFSELSKINESIRSSSERRLQLEMEVAKLDRLTKNEELRCKLADEKLEAMNFV